MEILLKSQARFLSDKLPIEGGRTGLEIRYITESDDRLVISRIYEESWKYAYKGIVPQGYLDAIPEGQWAVNMEQEGRKLKEVQYCF